MFQTMARPAAPLLAALLLFPTSNWAYEVPLASRSVRDAYFLGQRNNDDTDAFLEKYTRRFPIPPRGPHISEVRLLTPYAQAVEISRHKTLGYSAQQAEAEYKTRGDSLLVRVRIDFTPTYNDVMSVKPTKDDGSQPNIAPRPEDFWKDFRFLLTQDDEPLQYRNISGEPQFCSACLNSLFPGVLVGAYVNLDYDARSVPSQKTQVEIFTPDGQHVVASFDLAALR
jgi:hypothetical protein